MPVVTVVIPVFNRMTFIDRAIDSFEMQEGNHELIIVDDGGSTPYTEKMKRYVVRVPENIGTPNVMNYGIKRAHGKYITELGDDDLLIGPDSLNVRASALDVGHDMVYTDALEIDCQGLTMKEYRRGFVTKEMIWAGDCINLHSMMWRKTVHAKIGYQDERLKWDDDWEWKIRLIHEVKCTYLPVVTAATRYHPTNKSLGSGRAGVNKDHELTRKICAEKYGYSL